MFSRLSLFLINSESVQMHFGNERPELCSDCVVPFEKYFMSSAAHECRNSIDALKYLRLERKSDSLIGRIADRLSKYVGSSPALVL